MRGTPDARLIMTTTDRKHLLVALCACDRVELCLHHFRPTDPKVAFLRQLRHAFPWVGLVTRLFRRSPAERSRSSSLAPLFQLAMGFFQRRR